MLIIIKKSAKKSTSFQNSQKVIKQKLNFSMKIQIAKKGKRKKEILLKKLWVFSRAWLYFMRVGSFHLQVAVMRRNSIISLGRRQRRRRNCGGWEERENSIWWCQERLIKKIYPSWRKETFLFGVTSRVACYSNNYTEGQNSIFDFNTKIDPVSNNGQKLALWEWVSNMHQYEITSRVSHFSNNLLSLKIIKMHAKG